jgi:hypothetical protein
VTRGSRKCGVFGDIPVPLGCDRASVTVSGRFIYFLLDEGIAKLTGTELSRHRTNWGTVMPVLQFLAGIILFSSFICGEGQSLDRPAGSANA